MSQGTITVQPDIWNLYPGLKLVCVVGNGLDNSIHRTAVEEFFLSSQVGVFESLRSIELDHYPPFFEWRRVQPGAKFPAAHEALGTRAAACRPLRSISPFVDWYNAVSLDMLTRGIAAPIGAWCSKTIPEMRLLITVGGETFTELGKTSIEVAQPGEIAYADASGRELVTRHFVWRQSRLGAIAPDTTSFVLISEILEPFSGRAETVRTELVTTCETMFSINTASTILEEGSSFSWRI
jgi:DNA/RNA-binding domain of Phe-tRNA-synthetase-like protein